MSRDMINDTFMLVVDLITRPPPRPEGKILIIGGGIANFTNVAATFKGIIRALEGAKAGLIAHGVGRQQSLSNDGNADPSSRSRSMSAVVVPTTRKV